MVLNTPDEIKRDGRLHYIYRYLVDSVGVWNTDSSGIHPNTTKLDVPGYFKRIFKDRDKVLSIKVKDFKNFILNNYPEAYSRKWV